MIEKYTSIQKHTLASWLVILNGDSSPKDQTIT